MISWLAMPFESAIAAPLSATFLQFQTWMPGQIDDKAWAAEIDAMKAAGIDTVLLQWLKYDAVRFYPVHAPGNDPVEAILATADRHGMKVFLGLSFDSDWWLASDDPAFLKRTAERAGAQARKAWKRYGHHKSLGGWYVPYELPDLDYDDEEIAALRDFYRAIARACRKVAPGKKLPVAMSAYFTGRLPPAAVTAIARKLYKGAELDVVIVQDGVGANRGEGKVKESVTPYLAPLADAIRQAGARPWVAVEIFRTPPDVAGKTPDRVPADGTRILEQLAAASAVADRTVMFDFFHYMSPRRGEPQKALFQWFTAHRAGLVGK